MGEILGLGLSHFPGFIYPDETMSVRVKETITSRKVPAELKNPENWPEAMRKEWSDDEGLAFAAKHRAEYFSGVSQLRAALDDFNPDLVIMFGDDQYENFHEDIIPPYCVYIAEQYETKPFARIRPGVPEGTPTVWNDDKDKVFVTPGHPRAARFLLHQLFYAGFELPYSYKFLHHEGLGHAFINTLLYLDNDRKGWNYPLLPIHINAYGSSLVRNRGGSQNLFSDVETEPDPPSPTPRRAFELGQAVARIMKESPWKTAIIGSSSWSHAFLTPKHHYVWPDVDSDKQRYEELSSGNLIAWRDLSLETIEDAGEQELLNWIPMAGAMYELGQKSSMTQFVESYLMNSCKAVALFPPASANSSTTTAAGGAAVSG